MVVENLVIRKWKMEMYIQLSRNVKCVSCDQLLKKNGKNYFRGEPEIMDSKRSLSMHVSTIQGLLLVTSVVPKIMDDLCFQTPQSEEQTEQIDS